MVIIRSYEVATAPQTLAERMIFYVMYSSFTWRQKNNLE